MPAVRLPISEIPGDGYTDWDETTDVVRLTEVGEPPKAVHGRDRAVLLRADGVTAGQVCSVPPAGSIIGRAPDAGVSIEDPGVSRAHARLTPTPSGRHLLEDLGSRNGTFVRGKRVKRALLEDGDMVQLGPRVSFRYVVVDSSGEALFRQLYQSSVRDALTGAYNRRHFDERFATELAFAARHNSDLSLVLFDVDHFKKVNDVYGHPAGDAVLCHVVKLAQRQLRAEDVFARYGGEEFAVLLRGIGPSGAMRAAERIRTTIEVIPGARDGRIIAVTVSGGVASVSENHECSAEAILSRADARLYRAKHEGRNRMHWRD
jgi:diguanylate cyclase (GGDEF)-like protein